MNRKDFDERQLKIRGDIFRHMFIVTIALLLINMMLASAEIVWAGAFHQYGTIMLVITAVGAIEMIIREVYVSDTKGLALIAGIMGIASLISIVSGIRRAVTGAALIVNGALTDNGGSLAMMAPLFAVGLCAAAKLISNRLKKTEEEER